MQNINVKKTDSIINKKMNSDKKITKYQNEIIKLLVFILNILRKLLLVVY